MQYGTQHLKGVTYFISIANEPPFEYSEASPALQHRFDSAKIEYSLRSIFFITTQGRDNRTSQVKPIILVKKMMFLRDNSLTLACGFLLSFYLEEPIQKASGQAYSIFRTCGGDSVSQTFPIFISSSIAILLSLCLWSSHWQSIGRMKLWVCATFSRQAFARSRIECVHSWEVRSW